MIKRARLLGVDPKEYVRIERWCDEKDQVYWRKIFSGGMRTQGWQDREALILSWMGSKNPYPRGMVRVRNMLKNSAGQAEWIETHDAGVPVATWNQVEIAPSDGSAVLPSPFHFAWNWWSLMVGLLDRFHELHKMGFVHVDLKSNNVCIPVNWKAKEGLLGIRHSRSQFELDFEEIRLIDLTHSLLRDRPLEAPLPLGDDPRYQSRMLIRAIRADHKTGFPNEANQLDYRVDLIGLGKMMQQLLPPSFATGGWIRGTPARAQKLVDVLLAFDQNNISQTSLGYYPHRDLLKLANAGLQRLAPQELWSSNSAGLELLHPRQKRKVLNWPIFTNWFLRGKPRLAFLPLLLKSFLMGGSLVILLLLIARGQGW